MPASLYNVTITFTPGSANNSNGAIDNTTIPQYMSLGDAPPATVAASIAKTCANERYKFLCQQLSMNQNIYLTGMVATGADCNTAPSSFNFLATVEHGDDSIFTTDETTNYTTSLVGIPALIRMVARALIEGRTSLEVAYFDPTTTPAPGNSTVYARDPSRVAKIAIPAVTTTLNLATSMVTVTKVA